jgi:hypothetical protein
LSPRQSSWSLVDAFVRTIITTQAAAMDAVKPVQSLTQEEEEAYRAIDETTLHHENLNWLYVIENRLGRLVGFGPLFHVATAQLTHSTMSRVVGFCRVTTFGGTY